MRRLPSTNHTRALAAEDLLAQVGDFNAAWKPPGTMRTPNSSGLLPGGAPSTPTDHLNIAVGEYARLGPAGLPLVENRAWYVLANSARPTCRRSSRGMEADVYLVSARATISRVVQGVGWANRPADGETVGVLPAGSAHTNWVRLANRFQVRVRPRGAGSRRRSGWAQRRRHLRGFRVPRLGCCAALNAGCLVSVVPAAAG